MLYMYYLGFRSLAEYRLKITSENGFMKVDFLLADNQIYYTGTREDVNLPVIKKFVLSKRKIKHEEKKKL